MTRPWNETKGDLRNEAAVANALVEHIPHYGGWFKNPLSIGMDVSMLDADKHLVNAFYEIKCRKASWTTYETVIISLIKVKVAMALRDASGLPVFFAWRWADNVVTILPVTAPEFVTVTGNNREVQGDTEPCGHYTIADMHRMT